MGGPQQPLHHRKSSETLPPGSSQNISNQTPSSAGPLLHRRKSGTNLAANFSSTILTKTAQPAHQRVTSTGSLNSWIADGYKASPHGIPLGNGAGHPDAPTIAREKPYAVNQTRPLPPPTQAPAPRAPVQTNVDSLKGTHRLTKQVSGFFKNKGPNRK